MHRKRNESRWEFTRHYSAPDFFAIPRTSGAHTIKVGSQLLDLLIEDRLSPTTLVVFHSALTNHVRTVPVLQGHELANRAGINLISVSDPSIALGDIDLAWFLGNRGIGDLRNHLSPLIRHAANSLHTERLILFGASGGGYAALNFGSDFPGSMVFVVNPRTNLSARPHTRMNEYLRVCHSAASITPMLRIRRTFVTENVADKIGTQLPFDALLCQNLGDRLYLENQAQPFIESFRQDTRMFHRFDDYGVGHKPIPREMLQGIIDTLAMPGDPRQVIMDAGFSQPSQNPGDEYNPSV